MYIFIYICFPARSHRSACGFLSHWVGVVVLSAILTIIFCVRTGVDFRPTVFPSFISAASLAVPLQAYHTQSRLMKEAVEDEEQHGGGEGIITLFPGNPIARACNVHLVLLSSLSSFFPFFFLSFLLDCFCFSFYPF